MTQEFLLNPYTDHVPMRVHVRHVDKYIIRCHKTPRILLILQGTLQLGLNGKVFELEKNHFAIINSNEIYSTFSTAQNNMLLSIQISPDTVLPDQNIIIDTEKLLRVQKEHPEMYVSFSKELLQIAAECNKSAPGYEDRAVMILRHLYMSLQSEDLSLPQQRLKKDADETQMRLMKILSEINDRCSENLTLEDVAEASFMNYYHLSHFFKDRTGINFRDYLAMCRLSKAIDMLNQKNKSVMDIAYECGFGSSKAFLASFRKIYRITPSEYRRRLHESVQTEWDPDSQEKPFSFDEDVRRLLQQIERSLPSLDITKYIVTRKIELDSAPAVTSKRPIPKRLLNFGQAKEGLYAAVQEQIQKIVSQIPFEYVRFQGIFSDAMGICNAEPNGNIAYCWTYLDMLLDFLVGLRLKIFMQLSYMPSALASENRAFFWCNVNTSAPKDIKNWCDLVNAMIRHCIQRYGRETVSQWCFEVWNEPDNEKFWHGTKEEYFQFYLATALAVKSADSQIKVGGPGVTLFSNTSNKWLADFMRFCELSAAPLDFVSIHVYGEYSSEEEEYLFPVLNKRRLVDQDVTEQISRQISEIRKTGGSIKVYISEWNLTVRQRFLVRDTAFMAPYIADSFFKLATSADMLGYWTMSDMIEELAPPSELFHGGLGLMTNNGIPKPSVLSLSMISRLGAEILSKGENWVAARKGKIYQIFVYNMAMFDSLSMSGEFSSLTKTDRYNIYLSTVNNSFRITLNGISGTYRVVMEKIDREHGSAFDAWLQMGAPSEIKMEDAELLRDLSKPQKTVQIIECSGFLTLEVACAPHGCVLVEISEI